ALGGVIEHRRGAAVATVARHRPAAAHDRLVGHAEVVADLLRVADDLMERVAGIGGDLGRRALVSPGPAVRARGNGAVDPEVVVEGLWERADLRRHGGAVAGLVRGRPAAGDRQTVVYGERVGPEVLGRGVLDAERDLLVHVALRLAGAADDAHDVGGVRGPTADVEHHRGDGPRRARRRGHEPLARGGCL